MEFYYLSKHPIRLCMDYMKHFNIYDPFLYTWEERGDYFLITFEGNSYGIYWAGERYRNGSPWAGRVPTQRFKVKFEDLGGQTGIRVQFISTFLFKNPGVPTVEIDRFWERKLDARKIGKTGMFGFWKKSKREEWEREDQKMFCIVGLGNPEKKYENTRHNIGFDVIDAIAEKYSIAVREKGFRALFGKGVIEGQRVILVKPQTYMNLSGESVREVTDYYKIDAEEELIVISDDIALEAGGLRIRKKGSAGGHNGLKNIIKHLGTENFMRIRMGVGEKPKEWDLADYVLGRFPKEEREKVDQSIKDAVTAVEIMVTDGADRAMNAFNRKKQVSDREEGKRDERTESTS